jgi:gluconolactonase
VANSLADLLETTEPEQLATGFTFTEGPSWHPDGFFYFVDLRVNRLHKIVPGQAAELVLEPTGEANGTTFDLEGRLVMCEGGKRRIARMDANGNVEVVVDRFEGKRFNRPNDIVCKSDGCLFFTDPGLRIPLEQKELANAGVYRLTPDGALSLVADCEYPNGLAFSPDEKTLYVANSRWAAYIHALELNDDGTLKRRRIFADMSSDEPEGVPDGMKVDVEGNVYCTGPGGVWVFSPDGKHLGTIRPPEVPANLAFGGPDRKTLFFTARTSLYTLRTKVAGIPNPWVAKAG